jgi:hypothetical protein
MAAVLFHSHRFLLLLSVVEWLLSAGLVRWAQSIQLASTSHSAGGLDLRTATAGNGLGSGVEEPGAVAQLGERLICIQEVVGSIPISSTSRPAAWACSSGG